MEVIHEYSRPLYEKVKKWTLMVRAVTGGVMVATTLTQGFALPFVVGTSAPKFVFYASFIWITLSLVALFSERLFGKLAGSLSLVFACLARQILTYQLFLLLPTILLLILFVIVEFAVLVSIGVLMIDPAMRRNTELNSAKPAIDLPFPSTTAYLISFVPGRTFKEFFFQMKYHETLLEELGVFNEFERLAEAERVRSGRIDRETVNRRIDERRLEQEVPQNYGDIPAHRVTKQVHSRVRQSLVASDGAHRCLICLEEYSPDCAVVILKSCRHMFHE